MMRFLYIFLWLLLPKGYLTDTLVKTTNIVCQTNDKFVEGTKCYVQTLSWDKSLGQMDCFLKEPLKNPTVHLQFLRRDNFKKYQPFLPNFSFSLCDVISKNKVTSLSAGMWQTLRKYTNANHSCPFSGHLFARNISLDAINIPTMPVGGFLTTINFIETYPKGFKESYGAVHWYFDIMQRKDRKLKPKIGG